MDFSDDFEVSTPCLIVQSSQNETCQRICQSDSDPFFLKQLNISRSSESSKLRTLDDKSLDSDRSDPRVVGESIGGKQCGIMRIAGGSEDGKNQSNSHQGGNSNNESRDVARHVQACPFQGAGGGGGGAGGDDGGGSRDNSHHEPSSCNDDTSHSEQGTTSSSDSFPELIKPSELTTRGGSKSDNSVMSTSGSPPEVTISQASTVVAGEDTGVPSLVKKSSSSSSSGGYRSDLTSSSVYQASVSSAELSSLSSDSHGASSGGSHYPLPLVVRTQSELDSSTSAGSEGRGGPGSQKTKGFSNLESIGEDVSKQDHSTSDSSKDQNEQECSSQEDLFGYNKEDSTVISSQEVSRLSTPRDRSTPVEQKLSQDKASDNASSLHRKVLSIIQTSTPVESNQTPPSENITPNQSFQCFQLSGEVVKESSESSSSGVVKPSPDLPAIIPDSPTLSTSFKHSSSSSGQSAPQNTTSKSVKSKVSESSGSSLEQLPPSPSSFQYPWRKDSLQPSPEEEEEEEEEVNNEQKSSLENDDEEFIGLPRWQKELIQKTKKDHSVSSKSQSTPSTSSSSSSLEKEKPIHSAQHFMQHSWQSEMPSTVEENKSYCLSKKHGSRSSEVKSVRFLMDDDDSEPTKETYKSTTIEYRKPESTGIAQSLSPSSIDGQKCLAKDDAPSGKEAIQTSVVSERGPTCAQPDMSEDVFRPLLFSTQESIQDKSRQHAANAPEAQEEVEDQDIDSQSFQLHFSQSQTDMDSPPLIPESYSPPLTASRKEGGSGSSPENPPSSSVATAPTSTASADVSREVILPLSSLLKNPNSHSVSTPSQSILEPVVRDTEGDYRSLERHEERTPEALDSLTNSKPSALDEIDAAAEKRHDRVPVPPLSSETSSDSMTGLGFHFSLPTSTEPLRPVTCTTPPPMRSRQTAIPTTVCETPGIFSQEPSNVPAATSATKNQTTPSLTLSMPRQSESDSEMFFQMREPTKSASSSSSSTDPLEASRTQEESVFAQVRDKTSSSGRRERHKDEEYNPFEFTSQDDDFTNRPPISRRKSSSGSSRESTPQASKIARIDPSRKPDVDERNIPGDSKGDSGQSTAASGEDSSVQRFHRVTETKIVKKITTEVVKHVTIILTKQGQENKVVEKICYVEEEKPTIQHSETYETDEVDFIQRDDSISEIVRRPATPPTQPAIPTESPRRSPRGKKRPNENQEALQSGNTKKQKLSSPEMDGKAKERTSGQKKNETRKDEDDSPPLLRRESTEKIIEAKAGSSRTPDPALDLVPGTRVFAHWSDNHFYPGVLTSGASRSGFYHVAFDDGDKRKMRAERLILRDSLHTGQHVLAQDADGYYDPGIIVGHYRHGDENGYEIKDKKGKIKRYPSRNVILTEEQAAAILSSSSSSLSRTSSSSVSAGGLNARPSTSRSSSSNVSTGGRNSRSLTSAKDTSCSSNDLTRGGISITSPSTSKPTEPTDETPKSSRKKSFKKNRKAAPSSWKGNQKESSSEASSDERNKKTRCKRGARKELAKILPTRTSPRKREKAAEEKIEDQDAETSALGPLPSDDSLFAGFAFLITGNQNTKEKESKHDSPDSESESVIEFSREHLVRQIEAGGGVVLKDFQETQNSGADKCFLVSSSHQRTRKFFQCLAYDIPIVHHSWIHDSSMLDELRDYKKYLLPAGTSLETGEVMECQTQPKPKVLQGLKIYLHGDQHFKKTWSSVVLAAGCSVVAKLPNRPGRAAQFDDFDTLCDVIIAGTNTLPASVRHTVEMLGIPVVALEWLFQCLINGFLVPFDGHPKYDYRNIQKDDHANL